jgi:hypothetical protein
MIVVVKRHINTVLRHQGVTAMSDELKFVVQLGLNLAAILVAAWLAARFTTRQVRKVLEAERQAGEASRCRAQAQLMTGLPSIPPQLEQMVEIERWLLNARDLQLHLTSLNTLVRIRLRADETTRQGVFTEVDRSLKFLGRQEKKWFDPSLQIIAYVRQLDPAKGKAGHQTLEHWMSRLNQVYVQAAQSLRRAVSLCETDGLEPFSATLVNSYLTEAEQSTSDMMGTIASALDRLAYLKQQSPDYQAQQITAASFGRMLAAQKAIGSVPEESNI